MFNLIEWLYLKQPNNLVYYDTLTKIHSRQYYDRIIKTKYIPYDCIIIVIDVDNLKVVNDTKGHNEGSKLIKRVAENIKSIEPLDCARYGGDEFIVILNNEDYDKLEQLKNIEKVSMGYYEKEQYEDMSSAIKKADEDMYKHKKEDKK